MISFHKLFLKTFPPEVAHYLTIQLLKIKPKLKYKYLQEDRKLYQHLWGLDFNNPIGLIYIKIPIISSFFWKQ